MLCLGGLDVPTFEPTTGPNNIQQLSSKPNQKLLNPSQPTHKPSREGRIEYASGHEHVLQTYRKIPRNISNINQRKQRDKESTRNSCWSDLAKHHTQAYTGILRATKKTQKLQSE